MKPRPAALNYAINQGIVTITRRIEIYHYDNVTPWDPEDDRTYQARAISGQVSVDYERDERRAFDCTLDNTDGLLLPRPTNGLWYDKIIKIFRGYRYPNNRVPPTIAIIEANNDTVAYAMRNTLYQLGFPNIIMATEASNMTYPGLENADIFLSNMTTTGSDKSVFLKAAWNAGKHIITMGNTNAGTVLPFVTSTAPNASANWGITPTLHDNPVKTGWVQELYGADAGTAITGLSGAATPVATYLDGATTHYTGVIGEHANGAKWFNFQPHQMSTQGKILLKNVLNFMWGFDPYGEWECQLGEFMIDKLDWQTFPGQIMVSGRDMTKKMMNSKITDPSGISFEQGTNIRDIIKAVAANSGITKLNVNMSAAQSTAPDLLLDKKYVVAQETSRWTIAKDLANQFGFEIFFNAEGYLTTRPFIDPTLGAISYVFQTGKNGNLTDLKKSVDDSLIYNRVTVIGDKADGAVLPYFGEAMNVDPGSPTNIDRIGERTKFMKGNVYKSNKQCRDTAKSFLKIGALEPFTFSLDHITFPWLEAGNVAQVIDPDAADYEPDRFLLTQFTIPLSLGIMTNTARRVTVVKSDSEYVDEQLERQGTDMENVVLGTVETLIPKDVTTFNTAPTRDTNKAPKISPA